MNGLTPAHVFRFGIFELDTNSGELRRHGLKIRLPDQSFQILKELLNRSGEVVTREELRRVLWTIGDLCRLRGRVEQRRPQAARIVGRLRRESAVRRNLAAARLPIHRVGLRSCHAGCARSWCRRRSHLVPRRVVASSAEAVVPARGACASPAGARPCSSFSVPRSWPPGERRCIDVEDFHHSGDPGGAEPIRALLVIPFENLTGDAAQDYFVDSVTDALTVHLSQVQGMDVIARTTAMQYRKTGKRLSEIGRELPVNGIVSGTVVQTGTGVRITAQLGRVSTDRVEWGKAYEGELSHMLDLQQKIASEIAVAAGLALPPSHSRRPAQTIAAQAYDAYLKGLTVRGAQQHDAFSRAVGYFEQAIAMEPDFAEAHAALALTQMQFLFGGPFSPHEAIPKAEAAARKALQLDDSLAQAHAVLGQILALYHWRWEDSAKALQRAAEVGNGGEEFTAAMSLSLMRQGRFDDAIAAAERGRKRDPLSLNAQVAVGTAYRAVGQYDRALAELRRALAMSPGNSRVHFQLGATFAASGRMDDAIRELEIAARPAHGHNSRIEAYLGYAYAAAGRTLDARAVLKELDAHRRDQYVSAFGIALIHDALGEGEPAVAAVERARDDHAVEFAMIGQYPAFKTIASEPRFLAVMRQVGLPR